jgi:galactokinase
VTTEKVHEVFQRAFGGAPSVVASAPARVNLIGEHTDYNGGEVLPIAIARRTFVAVRHADGPRSRAASANEAAEGEFDAAGPARAGAWWDYLSGVVHELRRRGTDVPQVDVGVWSDVPAGAGLSSSAALEVATALALTELTAGPAKAAGAMGDESLKELALLSQRAESGFVGVACGIMDQFASALGRRSHALHVWCDTAETEHVPMQDAVLIFDTAIPRSLRHSDYNTRRAECDQALALLRRKYPALITLAEATPEQVRASELPAPLDRRALHVCEETRRVREMVAALRRGGSPPGDLLLASHASLRDNYECSRRELDWFVERVMRADGVRGARLTGAGWGGCAIAVGAEQALREAAPAIAAEYERSFGIRPRFWHTRAEDGAGLDGRK